MLILQTSKKYFLRIKLIFQMYKNL